MIFTTYIAEDCLETGGEIGEKLGVGDGGERTLAFISVSIWHQVLSNNVS